MDIEESLKKLFSLHTFGVKLGLDNIRNFLKFIGDPQLKLKTIHLAGSNGKGSTASFIASIIMEFGYKVGLYTSPHFVRFNERIIINGIEIPDIYIANFVTKFWNYITENKLTFFEVTTALAFQFFNDEEVDYAVIETGLGGRLDATNVLQPLAVVITSISLEHTNILGSTVKQIASEKAAIIKNNIKVFTGKLPEAANDVVSDKCGKTNSELFMLEEYINEHHNLLELYTEEIELDDWAMPLKGDYQKYNAALAALTVAKTLNTDDSNKISHGIKNVIKNTGLQGRFEMINSNPDIILDSAHNPAGIESFLSEFKKHKDKYGKKVLLFGVMKDKSIAEMLNMLKDYFDEIHLTEINYERSCPISELVKIAEQLEINYKKEPDYAGFINKYFNEKEDNCLVVLGSMYVLGEIKSNILKQKA